MLLIVCGCVVAGCLYVLNPFAENVLVVYFTVKLHGQILMEDYAFHGAKCFVQMIKR